MVLVNECSFDPLLLHATTSLQEWILKKHIAQARVACLKTGKEAALYFLRFYPPAAKVMSPFPPPSSFAATDDTIFLRCCFNRGYRLLYHVWSLLFLPSSWFSIISLTKQSLPSFNPSSLRIALSPFFRNINTISGSTAMEAAGKNKRMRVECSPGEGVLARVYIYVYIYIYIYVYTYVCICSAP